MYRLARFVDGESKVYEAIVEKKSKALPELPKAASAISVSRSREVGFRSHSLFPMLSLAVRPDFGAQSVSFERGFLKERAMAELLYGVPDLIYGGTTATNGSAIFKVGVSTNSGIAHLRSKS